MSGLRAAHNGTLPEGFEVFMDGGIRRGTDVFKALALGASAVGIGKPVVSSQAICCLLLVADGPINASCRCCEQFC